MFSYVPFALTRITMWRVFCCIICIQVVYAGETLDSFGGDLLETANKMRFFVYTRETPLKLQEFFPNNITDLKRLHFNAEKPTKILTHGWKCSYLSAFNVLIKNAYLLQYDVNVIVVDWNSMSQLNYWEAKHYVPMVGNVTALIVDELISKLGVKPDDLHIVGHSLGGHVAGIAGLLAKFGPIGRVTGLDPAGPLFSISDELRISDKSAKFVDVIHTAGYTAGFYSPLGHVDFYPNGGFPIQPGCTFDFTTLKSHRRAYWLFAESIITPGGFIGLSCGSFTSFKNQKCGRDLSEMGEYASKWAKGKYYLLTNYKTPFALGNRSLEVS